MSGAESAPKLSVSEARTVGKREGEEDIGRGHFEIRMMGRPPGWMDAYRTVMLQRYGIVVRLDPSCISTEAMRARMDAYNEVSRKAILERFGAQVDRDTLYEQMEIFYREQPDE